jgi:prepilin-type N-terminal cleavage/methylation domain-containing protein
MVGQVSQMLRKKHVKGITLVELMVVLVILAIIAAIALPYFMTPRKERFTTLRLRLPLRMHTSLHSCILMIIQTRRSLQSKHWPIWGLDKQSL